MNEEEYHNIYTKLGTDEETFKDYEIIEGILYKIKDGRKLQVVRRFEIEGVMYMMHDHALSAHFGINATYERIKERYYWKGIKNDVETYVKTCNQCQKRGKPKGKNELHSIKVKEPFYQIGIDFVGPLPQTQKGNKYIIVAMDYFTKWPEAKAVKEATAKEVSEFIMDEIICRHGCPKKILSDRGSHFNNEMIRELTEKCGIKHNFSTPYHPQSNGLVERFNKTLCEALAKVGEKGEWDVKIPQVLFAYRTKKQESAKIKPFYLVYGREERLLMDKGKEVSMMERIKDLIEELPRIRNKTKKEIEKAQNKQKEYHNRKIKIKEKYEIGDKVLYYKAAKEKQWSGKLEEKWKGPYLIHEIHLNGSYKIKELDGKILKVPVNGELLKKYYSRENFEPYVVI
jgi:hypothetical protein